jgi:hypothetical protein
MMLPPYSLDITDMEFVRYIDLVTGELGYSQGPGAPRDLDGLMEIVDHARHHWHRTPCLFLAISGYYATSLRMVSLQFNRYVFPDGFYLDKFGAPDVGMERGQYLTLDAEKLEALLDDFLSGKIHDVMRS